MPPPDGPRLRLVAAPWTSLYDLPVDLVVEEQDRDRVLGLDEAPPRHDGGSFDGLLREVAEERKPALGELLFGGGRPPRLRAVLLDLEHGRQVAPGHLREVADRLVAHLARAPVRRLGMPILGTVHGDAAADTFAEVFAPRLRRTNLETFYLLAGSNPDVNLLRRLRAAFQPDTD